MTTDTFDNKTIDEYLDSLRSKGRSKNTIKAYNDDLRAALRWLSPGWCPLADLPDLATRYINESREYLAPSTIHRRIGTLRAFMKFHDLPDSLADYRAPTGERPTPHPLPEGTDGVLRMMDAARQPHHAALVALCGLCGLRVSEARSITRDSFDFVRRDVLIVGKGDRRRRVPVASAAWPAIAVAIAAADEGGAGPIVPINDRSARKAITRLAKRAGLERHVSSHDLRATFATATYGRCLDLRVVQELLGHASTEQTLVYVAASETTMRTAVEVT